MNITELEQLEKRTLEIYEQLVNETDNPDTIYYTKKNDSLSLLLDTFEYLLGNESENPIPEYFK